MLLTPLEAAVAQDKNDILTETYTYYKIYDLTKQYTTTTCL